MEKIIAVAFFNKSSQIVITRPGYTSHTALEDGAETMLKIPTSHDSWVKGFYTSESRFVDRKNAWEIAEKADQIKDVFLSEGELFSSDLK